MTAKKNVNREIWVFCQYDKDGLLSVTLELLGEAKRLAETMAPCGKVAAVILGSRTDSVKEECRHYDVDKIYAAESPFLEKYATDSYAKVIAKTISCYQPEIFLFGATFLGRDLAPRVAAMVDTGLTADGISMEMKEDVLYITKPAFGERLLATIVCKEMRPQMATVRPGIMKKALRAKEAKTPAQIQTIDLTQIVDIPKSNIRHIQYKQMPDVHKKLAAADCVVCGGLGLGNKEGLSLVQQLADKIGGAVGVTRQLVDAGWAGKEMQVGQTGTTIAPKLLITCGVSGALQFTAGVEQSQVIVAINTDPHAPIFDIAHYCIVGDVYQIIPQLIVQWDRADALVEKYKKHEA